MKMKCKDYKIEILKSKKPYLFYCYIYDNTGDVIAYYIIPPCETVYNVQREIICAINVYESSVKEANKK